MSANRRSAAIAGEKSTFGYLSDLGECLGDHALTEIRRFQMADKPPSTDNSAPFTKLGSSEARNSATVAISSAQEDDCFTSHRKYG